MNRSLQTAIIWAIRIPVYGFGFYLALTYLYPLGFIGLVLAGPSAALVIGLDLFITAKIRKQTVSQAVAARLLRVDKALSPPGQSALGQLGAAREAEGLARKPAGELEAGDDDAS